MIKSIFQAVGWGESVTPQQAQHLPSNAKFEVGGEILTSPPNAQFAVSREIDNQVVLEVLNRVK